MSTRWDCVVIGSGVGGLAAALTAANAGRSVLVLEAARDLGGMLNPFSRKGYHFDVGVHYLGQAGPDQAMRRLLDRMGLESIRFREIDPDCIDRYIFDGYDGKLIKGMDRWTESLVRDFPAEASAIRGFSELMVAADSVRKTAMRGRPTARDALTMARFPIALPRLLNENFTATLNRWFRDPHLKAVYAGPGGDIGLPPGRASAFVSIMVLMHYLTGAYYPEGGSGAMRDAFVTAIEGKGGKLLTQQLVNRIQRTPDGFTVVTDGGSYDAKTVVSNSDAVETLAMLDGADPDARTKALARRVRPSLSSMCVFVGTDLDVSAAGITDSNIWHYGTNDIDAGYAPLFEGKMPEKPAYFLTAPTLKDPNSGRAPAGHHTIELISFVPSAPFKPWWDKPVMRRGADYQAMKREFADKLLIDAERYVPGLRASAKVVEVATPATVWHYVRGRDGGIYGPEHSVDQVGPRRFRTEIGVPGLYLCGASVIGAGVHPCLISGVAAGRKVIGA